MKEDKHKKDISKAPDLVPAPTPPSPEPTVMPIPIYDAGGRVKKYDMGGEVRDWVEPSALNIADDSDFGNIEEVVKIEDEPVIDVVENIDESE